MRQPNVFDSRRIVVSELETGSRGVRPPHEWVHRRMGSLLRDVPASPGERNRQREDAELIRAAQPRHRPAGHSITTSEPTAVAPPTTVQRLPHPRPPPAVIHHWQQQQARRYDYRSLPGRGAQP
jgi:hypothetical protein